MPFVPKYTTAELQQIMDTMKVYPPEKVQEDFLYGRIPLRDKLMVLSHYGAAQREIAIRGDMATEGAKTVEINKSAKGLGPVIGPLWGEAKYYAQGVFREYKAAWDAATAEGDSKKSEAVFHGIMGSLKILDGFNVPGDVVERWSLEAFPDAPGFARAANWAVWIPANFGGLTALLKAPFKAAQGAAKAAVKTGAAIADYASFLKNPVKYAVEQAGAYEAVTATKLAKAQAENVTRKGAGAAGAAIDAEAKGGTQAFKVAGGATEQKAMAEAEAKWFKAGADPRARTQLPLDTDFIDAAFMMTPDQAIKAGYVTKRSDGLWDWTWEGRKNAASFRAKDVGSGSVGQGMAALPPPAISPQDLEAMTVRELINHYAERSEKMIRSSTEPFKYKGVSHAETQAAAAAKPTDIWEILQRGPDAPVSATEMARIQPVHDEILKNFNKTLEEMSTQLGEIGAGTRPDLVAAYKAHMAAVEITNPAFLSGRGQLGRGMEYLKTMQPLINDSLTFDVLHRSLGAEKLLEGSNKAIAYTANKLYLLGKEERGKLLEAAGSQKYETPFMRLLYKSILFARPGIHVANMVGNTSSIMLAGANKTMSSLMPWSEVTWREASAYWSGMADSRTKFFELWKKAGEKYSITKAGVETGQQSKLIKYGPLGWLGFEDEVMEEVVSNGLAKARAVTEGLSKWDEIQAAVKAGVFELPQGQTRKKFLGEFIDSSMVNPENYGRLVEATKTEADYIIFHSPLSRGGEGFARAIRESPVDYLAPVIKFPINGIKMARDWTPGLQMFSRQFIKDVAEGGAKADARRSQMALSWMVSSQVYEAALRGEVTGAGPHDAKANAVWRVNHTPYAIHGVPIKWAEPFGTWFGFIADLAHARQEMPADNLQNAFEAIVMAGTLAVENNYWLRIMEGVTNSITDVKNVKDLNDIIGGVGKIAGQPVKTLLTGGGVGRAFGEAVNPEQPDMKLYGELKDLKNWFFAGTVWGTDTRPQLNYSGKIKLMPPVLGAKWLEDNIGLPASAARGATALMLPPMRQNSGENDPVGQFLDKHGLTLHDNWKYYGGTANIEDELSPISGKPRVSLSGDQAYNWKKIALNDVRQYGTNRTWNEAIAALDSDSDFLAKPTNEKQQEINRLYARYRKDSLDALRQGDPDIQRKELARDAAEAAQKGRAGLSLDVQEAPQHPIQYIPAESSAPAPSEAAQ